MTIGCVASGFPLPSISWKFGFESRPEDSGNLLADVDKHITIDTQVVNETFVSSYVTINGVKPEDGQQFICSAVNKAGANHQNFSLSVREGSAVNGDDREEEEQRFRLTLYLMVLAVALVVGLTLLVVSLFRAKRCSRVRTTKLSPNLNCHPIDILQNVKTSDLEMKTILMANKPEIALISDIIRDTTDLKAYRFGSDALTPDVTKYVPQYSQQHSSASTTLSSSVSFDTFRSTPPLVVLDSTSNGRTSNVTLHQFSADNRFQYKKLNSSAFNPMNTTPIVANGGPNECQKLLLFSAPNRTSVNILDMPSTATGQSYIGDEPSLLKPVLTHSVSHTLELDKQLRAGEHHSLLDCANACATVNPNSGPNSVGISVTQV